VANEYEDRWHGSMNRTHALSARKVQLYSASEAAAGRDARREIESDRGVVLDLQKLETFRVVASTRNFTRAALELGYCQSSITTHIKELERALGVRLFERRRFSKEIVLTEAGRVTLQYASRLLALAEEARAAVLRMRDETEPALSPLGR
jgi:molybdenum-dependent DNA-binding transcriptional regulator ModE